MPFQFIDENHKRWVIQSKGFNPDQYDIDPLTDQIIPKAPTTTFKQPAFNPPDISESVPVSDLNEKIKQTTALGAAGSHLLRAAPASIGALPAGIAAAEAIHTLTSPLYATGGGAWIPPTASLLGGAAVGAGVGLGVDKYIVDPLVRKFFPSFQKQLTTSQEEHPIASLGGELGAGLIAGRPSPTSLMSALRTGGRIGLKGLGAELPALSRAELQNLGDVAIGGAIPAVETGYDVATGQPVNPGEAAAKIGAGLLLNKLNKFGQFIGRTGPRAGEAFDNRTLQAKLGDELGLQNKFSPDLGQEARDIYKKQAELTPELKNKAQTEFDVAENQERPRTYFTDKTPKTDKYARSETDLISALKENFPEYVTKTKGGKYKIKETEFSEDTLREFLDKKLYGDEYEQYQESKRELRSIEEKRNFEKSFSELQQRLDEKRFGDYKAEQARLEAEAKKLGVKSKEQYVAENATVQKPVETTYQKQQNAAFKKESNYKLFKSLWGSGKFAEGAKIKEPGFLERFQAENKGEVVLPYDATGVVGKDETIPTHAIGLEGKTKFSEESELGTKSDLTPRSKAFVETAKPSLGEGKIKAGRALYNFFKEHFAPLRNVKLESDNTITKNGKPVPGLALARQGIQEAVSKINPELAGPDTIPHEFFHPFFSDLEQSPRASERRLAENFKKAIDESGALKETNEVYAKRGRDPVDAHEIATEGSAYEILNQLLNLDQSGNIKRAWKNILSGFKTKWLKTASIGDYERVLANRFLNDPSFVERYGSDKFVPKVNRLDREQENIIKTSEESELNYGTKNREEQKGPNPPLEKEEESNRAGNIKNAAELPRVEDKLGSNLKPGEVTKPEFKGYTTDELLRMYKSGELDIDKFKNLYPHASDVSENVRLPSPPNKEPEIKASEESELNRNARIRQGMENDLLNASGKAAKKAVESQRNFDEVVKHDLPSETAKRDFLEDFEKSVKKADEVSAFRDEPFSRQSEESELKNIDKSRPLYLVSSKVLGSDKELGLKTTSKFPAFQLDATLKRKIPPVEYDLLQKAGLDTFLKESKSLSPEELKDWVEKNGPRVEVNKMGEGAIPEWQKRYNQLTHEVFDSAERDGKNDMRAAIRGEVTPDFILYDKWGLVKGANKEYEKKFHEYIELAKRVLNENIVGSQASWQSISPKAEKNMTDYVEIAVTIPYNKNRSAKEMATSDNPGIKFPSSHNFPANTLGWARGYMETLPNGEKVFHVVEVQSDWGQEIRRAKSDTNPNWSEVVRNKKIVREQDHPLLKDYNRLVLKAAIEHAKANGADRIAISDAETAMMTEGHDQQVGQDRYITAFYKQSEAEHYIESQEEKFNTELYINPEGGRYVVYERTITPPQEQGMRLNYDKILPSIAEELTGSKGEKVSFGTHKNALAPGWAEVPAENPANNRLRKNLIFKNPDGTPKTDVSALSFPISETPEKFSLTGKKYSEESELARKSTPEAISKTWEDINNDPDFQKQNFIKRSFSELSKKAPLFSSDLDKLVLRAGQSGIYAAPRLKETFNKTDENIGRYLNPSMDSWNSLNKKDRREVYLALLSSKVQDKDLGGLLKPKLKEVYDEQRALLKLKQEDQIKANQPVQEFIKGKKGFEVVPRLPKINENYAPEVPSGKILDILINASGSEAFNRLQNDFTTHLQETYKIKPEQAKELFEDFLASYGGPIPANQTRFGAVRKSEGIGLPSSWLEQDPVVAFDRYWKRVSKDRAYYDSIESDPKMLHILGYSKDSWGEKVPDYPEYNKIPGNKYVRSTLDILQGQNVRSNPALDAISRIANNLILGPVTGLNDAFAAPFLAARFAPNFGSAVKSLSSLVNIKQSIINAKETGRIKTRISDMEDVLQPKSELTTSLRKVADGIAKVTGRERLEKFSRGITQGMAEYFIPIYKKLASSGNKDAIKFLDGLSNRQDWAKMDDKVLASRILDLNQGTYDPRGLPSWAIDSQLAPVLRLARWNIEQANTFYKHVLLPTKNGNFLPLFTTLFGAGAGGIILKELREKIQNKKLAIPSLDELNASSRGLEGNISAIAYNYMAGLSYIGALGSFGEIAKAGFDMAFKNKPQGYNYPLLELTGDTISNISRAANAIADGEDPIKVARIFAEQNLANSIQVGRIGYNWLGDKDVQTSKAENRRLRMFKLSEGLPYGSQGGAGDFNPFEGISGREFKKEGSPVKGVALARQLVQDAIQDSKEQFPNEPIKRYSTLRKSLESLKRNNLQSFPSPESSPEEFVEYRKYLEKLIGRTKAQAESQKYLKQREVNKFKSSLIPSI